MNGAYHVMSFYGVHTSSLPRNGTSVKKEKQLHQTEFAEGVEWRRGTVYNGGEIQGGFADEI